MVRLVAWFGRDNRQWALVLLVLAGLISFREHRSFQDLEVEMFSSPGYSESLFVDQSLEYSNLEDIEEGEDSADIISDIKKEGGGRSRNVVINNGCTLSSVLLNAGLSLQESYKICKKLSEVHNLKTLQIGQTIRLDWGEEDNKSVFKSLEFFDKSGNRVMLTENDGKYEVSVTKRILKTFIKSFSGDIKTNFPDFVFSKKIPSQITKEIFKMTSSIISLMYLRKGSFVEIVYEENRDEETNKVVGGRSLKYISAQYEGKIHKVYKYNSRYYNENGESLKKEFLIVPLKNRNTQVSSKFGLRRHPIIGIFKHHTGVDFAAKYGTEVYASAQGIVTYAGPYGNYGNYVKIRHSNGFETVYAHLSSYTVRAGERVLQGMLIGRVGRSGRVTGPHLHHEVLINKRHVDPQKYHSIGAERLSGRELLSFKKMKDKIEEQLRETDKFVA